MESISRENGIVVGNEEPLEVFVLFRQKIIQHKVQFGTVSAFRLR